MALAVLAFLAAAASAAQVNVAMNFSRLDAREFDGVGALSGGGGVTRLLIDYPDAQYEDVMDSLFGPTGASPHIIKVEIGGDTQSTEGTEPAHMHTADDLNCWRGYEWTVLTEAKKRNPSIRTYGLSWGVPAWAGDNTGNFFTQANIEFHLQWLKCAREAHGLEIDFLGIWNERAYQADWIVDLRRALDDAGYKATRIVAADDGGGGAWNVGKDMVANATLRAAVDGAIGVHYPYPSRDWAPAEVVDLGVPLWASEEWDLSQVNDYGGAMVLAETLAGNYISGRLTATIVWNLVFSWYAILPFSKPTGTVAGLGHSLVSAAEPWSGHWEWTPPAAAMAHTTQFSRPGWRYLLPAADKGAGAGSGYAGKVSFVTLVSPAAADGSVDFSVVITNAGSGPVTMAFSASDLPGPPPASLAVFATNASAMLARLPDAPFRGGFSVPVPANGIVTATTTRWGQGPYVPKHPVPVPKRFPRAYSDSFDGYDSTRTYPRYFSDLGGVFAVHSDPTPRPDGNKSGVLTQEIVSRPLAWESNPDPYTIIGDFNPPNGSGTGWSGYTVAVKAAITTAPLKASDAAYLKVCANIASYKRKGAPVQGQCLIVTADVSGDGSTAWELQDAGKTVSKGPAAVQTRLGEFQTIALDYSAGTSSGYLNGTKLFSVPVAGSSFGQAALGCGWHKAEFDDFSVTPSA